MNILITALGTLSASTIAKYLFKKKGFFVYGADINDESLIYSSRFVDEYYKFPSVLEYKKYLDFIYNFCLSKKIDLYIPIIDEEIELLTNNLKIFTNNGVDIVTPGSKTVNIARDKYNTNKFLKNLFPNIVINSYLLNEFDEQISYPIFIKPRKGRSSIDCFIANNDFEIQLIRRKKTISELIVQEYIKSTEIFSVDLIRSKKNKFIKNAIRRELKRNFNGAATVVEFVKNEYLNMISNAIAEKLDVDGIINIEFFKVGDSYKLIEINPRFPAGTDFTCMAGLNLIQLVIDIKKGNELKETSLEIGKILYRRCNVYE